MRAKAACAVILAVLGMTACVKKEVVAGRGGSQASVAPSLVVEQFMQAANAATADATGREKALDTLGRLFGTKDGPISSRDPSRDVQRRMFAIAQELRHTDFEIVSEDLVPGRTDEATQLTVRLTKEDKKFNVPFTLVRYKGDKWLVEKIGLEALTAPRN